MDKKLVDFLIKLAWDRPEIVTFLSDREKYLRSADLSPEAKEAILKGDGATIAALAEKDAYPIVFLAIVMGTHYKKKKRGRKRRSGARGKTARAARRRGIKKKGRK